MIEHLSSRRVQIREALSADSGPLGDVTSIALIEKELTASAEYVVKASSGTVSGIEIAQLVMEETDPRILFTPLLKDGDFVRRGDKIAKISGPARSILAGERISLEFLRRMSGIATETRRFVDEVRGTGAIILDTRKVFPGYGDLDKKAVRDGGGTNHRLNLSEMGLIKNNHIDMLDGNVELAIKIFRAKYPDIPLEVEVRNKKELKTALENNPDRILLDNMNNEETKSAVQIRNKYKENKDIYIPLEASGNMTIDRVRSVAITGVDFISVGALTHSVDAFDISLHIIFNK